MNKFKELIVWQKAIAFVTKVYELSKEFPQDELYGITFQIRRSSVSIPSNIAEGAGRKTKKEFSHFLDITRGSAYELETQLIISKNLDYMDKTSYSEIIFELEEIQKMLTGLQKSLNTQY